MIFDLTTRVDISGSEKDFVNEVITQNIGEVMADLVKGDPIKFAELTFDQKKEWVLHKFAEQFENIYENSVMERELNLIRQTRHAERQAKRGEKQ